jgi:biopolymer transport protein ExbB
VALVTTLGGLAVAIPAAILAHYFEGRIQELFHQIDELLFNLLPQIERYEGRLRVSHQSLGGEGTPDRATPASAAAEGQPAAALSK